MSIVLNYESSSNNILNLIFNKIFSMLNFQKTRGLHSITRVHVIHAKAKILKILISFQFMLCTTVKSVMVTKK